MAVDGVGGSRQAEQLDQARRSQEGQKSGAFSALMKGERQKADATKADAKGGARTDAKGEAAKKDGAKKADEKRGPAAEGGMLEDLLGRERFEGVEGKGSGEGKGGEGGGEGGASGKGGVEAAEGGAEGAAGGVKGKGGGAFGEKLRSKTEKGDALAKGGKAEKLGKSAKGEGAEKADAAAKKDGAEAGEKADAKAKAGAEGKELSAKEASRAEASKEIQKELRGEKAGGPRDSAESAKQDDGKTMQEQIARNMFPGEVPHPFLMQQIDAVQQVQAAQPVIPPEIVDRIVAQARFGTNAAGASEFQIQLKDDVFQGAELKIATKDGKVTVELIAKDAETAAGFEQKAQEIAKQLTDKGLNVENVSVSIAGQGNRQDASQGESRGKREQGGVSGVGGAKRGGGADAAAGRGLGSGLDSGGRTGKDYSA